MTDDRVRLLCTMSNTKSAAIIWKGGAGGAETRRQWVRHGGAKESADAAIGTMANNGCRIANRNSISQRSSHLWLYLILKKSCGLELDSEMNESTEFKIVD